MEASHFVLEEYLDRIGFSGKGDHAPETVRALMIHQLYAIPFENLDVQAGKIVSMIPEEIVCKIVHRKRGGYCYELNGLFAMALGRLGVPYRFVAARPMFYPVRRPKTHMALVVTLADGDWLFDLGFGSYGIREPIRLTDLDREIAQGRDRFRLSRNETGEYLLEAKVDGTWAKQYAFDRHPVEWIDFVPANYLNSTHPDAVFVQKRVIISHSKNGRKILFGDELKLIENGSIRTAKVPADEIEKTLSEHFGLLPESGATA